MRVRQAFLKQKSETVVWRLPAVDVSCVIPFVVRVVFVTSLSFSNLFWLFLLSSAAYHSWYNR